MHGFTVVVATILQVILYTGVDGASTAHVVEQRYINDRGGKCTNDINCENWLTCVDGICTQCSATNSVCGHNRDLNWPCCKDTTCESIPGLDNYHCRPNKNNCVYDSDCSHSGLKCLRRVGKCGICRPTGDACTLIGDVRECCSNFCDISVGLNGTGICVDLFGVVSMV